MLGAVLNAFPGESDDDEVLDVTSEILKLARDTRDMSPENQFDLVIDQFDETRIEQAVYDEIARLLREIATDAPEGVVCCVGTRERFYDVTDSDVEDLELQPFDVNDVRTYLDALGLDTATADRVHDAGSGSPYFVERIGQIAAETGNVASILADLSEVEAERRRMLEERFLATLDDFPQHLLRETCFLPELRPQPVAHILNTDIADVESTLRDLERRSILTRLGYSKGNPVYRLHGLQRDFLRERLSDEARAKQHASAAGFYAIELANSKPDNPKQLLTKEGIERHREYITSGVIFEYHLQQFPHQINAEDRVEQIFETVPNQEPSPREAALGYLADYRDYSIGAETLGLTPGVDVERILAALDDGPGTTRGMGATPGAIIRGLQAEDTLNDDQTEVLILVANTAAYVAQVNDSDADKEEVVEQFTLRRERLTTEEFPNAPELCKFGRVTIDFLKDTIAEESEADVWATLEYEYDVTHDDFQVLSDTVIDTGRCLLDWSVVDEMIEERDGETINAGLHLEGDASIEEEGIERSLLKNLSSPLFLVYRALQSPTAEQLDELSYRWSELEAHFEDNEIPFLAAFCRDIRETFVEPITGGAAKTRVGLELMNAIDIEEADVVDHEPVVTLVTVMKAANGVAAHDPEREES